MEKNKMNEQTEILNEMWKAFKKMSPAPKPEGEVDIYMTSEVLFKDAMKQFALEVQWARDEDDERHNRNYE